MRYFYFSGVIAAQSAQLTFMVGGLEEGLKIIEEVLHSMGRNVIYCGPQGSGQIAKICNNMLLGVTMAGLAEAMNLGIRLDEQTVVLIFFTLVPLLLINITCIKVFASFTFKL